MEVANRYFMILIIFILEEILTSLIVIVMKKKKFCNIVIKKILQKILIVLIAGLAYILDYYIIRTKEQIVYNAVIFFYLGREGLSILRNATILGLPFPKVLRNFFLQFGDEDE